MAKDLRSSAPDGGLGPPEASSTAVPGSMPAYDSRPRYRMGGDRPHDGLSELSRVVGDDLSELGHVVVHSEETLRSAAPNSDVEIPFIQATADMLPFSSERDLLAAICRLTIGWRSFACQITLERLSRISGIRNAKTLRKWLGDLHKRKLIRYVPIHGDLRGPIIILTLPEHIRLSVERNWRPAE